MKVICSFYDKCSKPRNCTHSKPHTAHIGAYRSPDGSIKEDSCDNIYISLARCGGLEGSQLKCKCVPANNYILNGVTPKRRKK